MQSRSVTELQQQVECVLGTLVKAAAVELTKLFESSYLAAAAAADMGRGDDHYEGVKGFYPLNAAESKQSVGVQVDVADCTSFALTGPLLCSDGTSFKECTVEEGLRPTDLLLADDCLTDPLWSALNVQPDTAETGDLVQSFLKNETIETAVSSHSQDETVSHKNKERHHESNASKNKQSSSKKKLYVIQKNGSDVTLDQTKFVCPLILKTQSTKAVPEQPVHIEPQQASVSTAKGKAYSPRLSDSTITPAQASVRPQNQLLLKLNKLDMKLLKPCAVQLVNLFSVPQDLPRPQNGTVNGNTGWPLPKDLRPHQSLHTGHRLCCFTKCENDIWRLQKIATHSRNGYACSNCGKTFKHRKILRRHERFHSGEKPYSCSVCLKTFALRKSLRRHQRFHTGERPHSCTQCGKCFRLRENLKAHLRFHTGEKPYSCSACGKTFRIQKNLEKHSLSCGFFVPSFRTIAGF